MFHSENRTVKLLQLNLNHLKKFSLYLINISENVVSNEISLYLEMQDTSSFYVQI
jgi:hypothetical protein